MPQQFSDSNRASIRSIQEDNNNWGVTPTTGITTEMRITSSSLVANKETVVSDELRFDRMVSDVTEVAASSGGDINFEYSAGAQDQYIEAFVLGSFSKDVSFAKFEGTTVDITGGTTITISGGDFTPYFTDGERIRLTGFLSQTNNDWVEVDSSAHAGGTTTLTVSGPTLVAETGNARSKIQIASDVFLHRDITISGVDATSSFDSTGTPFAGLETNGTLTVGQNINITGLGHETGTLTVVSTPANDETVTLQDGEENPLILEFDTGDGVNPGNISVNVADSPTTTVLAARIAAAINTEANKGKVNLSAVAAAAVVTIKNLVKSGMTLTDGTSGNITVGAPSGGQDSANGVFTITSIADGSIGVTPNPGDIAAGDPVTMQASMLRNPSGVPGGTRAHEVITPQSFTFETAFNDVNQYFTHDGMRIGTWSQSIATGAIVTGTFGTQGRETRRFATEQLTSASYTVLDAPTNRVMNATTNVGALEFNGAELTTAIQSIEFTGEATLRNQNAVGNKFPAGIGTGRFNLTGTVVAYFANADLYTAFIDHDTVSLKFSFTDLDDNMYVYTLPALKFTADPISPAGIDQDVLENLEWVAFRDQATKAMIQIDRFSNATPAGSQS